MNRPLYVHPEPLPLDNADLIKHAIHCIKLTKAHRSNYFLQELDVIRQLGRSNPYLRFIGTSDLPELFTPDMSDRGVWLILANGLSEKNIRHILENAPQIFDAVSPGRHFAGTPYAGWELDGKPVGVARDDIRDVVEDGTHNGRLVIACVVGQWILISAVPMTR